MTWAQLSMLIDIDHEANNPPAPSPVEEPLADPRETVAMLRSFGLG